MAQEAGALVAELGAAQNAFIAEVRKEMAPYKGMPKDLLSEDGMKAFEARIIESAKKFIPTKMLADMQDKTLGAAEKRGKMLETFRWMIGVPEVRGKYGVDLDAARKSLDINVGSGGGYLLPTEMASEILLAVREAMWMEPLMTIQSNAPMSVSMPKEATGPSFTWSSGTAGTTATGFTLANLSYRLSDVVANIPVPNALIMFAKYDVLGFINLILGLGLAEELAGKYLNGTGQGEPLGILNATGIGSTAQADTNFDFKDVDGLESTMKSRYKGGNGSVWIANQTVYGYIRNLRDGEGDPVFLNPRDGQAKGLGGKGAPESGLAGYIMGYPAYEHSGMPSTKLLRCNLKWMWGWKGADVEIATSADSSFKTNVTDVRLVQYVDAKPVIAEAFQVLTGISQ